MPAKVAHRPATKKASKNVSRKLTNISVAMTQASRSYVGEAPPEVDRTPRIRQQIDAPPCAPINTAWRTSMTRAQNAVVLPPARQYETDGAVATPSHYAPQDGSEIECILAVEASMTPLEFMGWLKGNILTYTWRYRSKNGSQDLDKVLFYTEMLRDRQRRLEDV